MPRIRAAPYLLDDGHRTREMVRHRWVGPQHALIVKKPPLVRRAAKRGAAGMIVATVLVPLGWMFIVVLPATTRPTGPPTCDTCTAAPIEPPVNAGQDEDKTPTKRPQPATPRTPAPTRRATPTPTATPRSSAPCPGPTR
jgi:hypothetical protein